MDFNIITSILTETVKNIGNVVGLKLSTNGIMKCNTPDNLNNLSKGIYSYTNTKILLNYIIIVFLLLINNIVSLAGPMFSVIFMIVLLLITIGVYYYYDSDYKSKKDTINKCLNDNYTQPK